MTPDSPSARTIALYPWFKFFQSLMFWQAMWFLYFQNQLSAAEAIVLYAIYDLATTLLEVPSGVASDRLGRRLTLIMSALAGLAGVVLLGMGGGFVTFVVAQILLGVSAAFASGTDTSLLYESLEAEGRGGEIEAQELRAWRFTFSALAVSAASGGAMALLADTVPFWASAVAFCGALAVALAMTEPPRAVHGRPTLRHQIATLHAALVEPVLTWLLVLSLLMYVFSHLPFVFGQPFILQSLNQLGLEAQAPVVSGGVTTIMMGLSLGVSLVAARIRKSLGLARILLLAFAIQITLSGALALSNAAPVITLLFLRMVPDALSRPFIVARIQPMLSDDSRATYLSVQSLAGRVFFAATLYFASLSTDAVGEMPHGDIQVILGWYTLAGLVALAGLALAARRVQI